jgi:hypothetical protein
MFKALFSAITALLITASASQAAFTVNIAFSGTSSGFGSITDDVPPGDQANLISGFISRTSSSLSLGGGVTLNTGSTFISNANNGNYPNDLPLLLSSISITQGTGTRTYSIVISDTNFNTTNFPLNQAGYAVTTINSPAISGGTISNSSVVTTAIGSTTSTSQSIGITSPGSSTAEPSGGVFVQTSSPFTLQTIITFTLTGATTFNFGVTSSVVPAPAPSALLLAGLGVPMFGLFRRRLHARKVEPAVAA